MTANDRLSVSIWPGHLFLVRCLLELETKSEHNVWCTQSWSRGDGSGRNLSLQALWVFPIVGGDIWLTSQSHFLDEFCVLAFIAGIAAGSVFNLVLSSLYVYNEKRL